MNIKSENIINAGTSLKNLAAIIVIMFIIILIAGLIIYNSTINDLNTIKYTYYFIFLICTVCNILALIQIYSAGDFLETSIITEVENSISLEIENKNLVKHKTNRGVLEIAPCINMKGQKAFINNEPAPDGVYRLGFLNSIEIKDGIVL